MSGAARLTVNGAVATITLDNEAKRNSLDFDLLAQLRAAAEQVAVMPGIAAVALRGAGDKAFCAGADFDAFATRATLVDGVTAMDAALGEAVAALERIPMPLVAGIGGACFGAGVQLALCADIRLATSGSKFGVPAVQIAMPYPLPAIGRLVQLLGAGAAAHVLLSAEPFDAATALRRGLVDELVEGDLGKRLDALCAAIAAHPPAASRAYKQMIRGLATPDIGAEVAGLHATFAAGGRFIPKLEEIAARRRAKG